MNLLKNAPTKAWTCKELGKAIWGEAYSYTPGEGRRVYDANRLFQRKVSTLGHILAHLVDNGYVSRVETKTTEPVLDSMGNTVMTEKYVETPVPAYIDVWDAAGNKYQMRNPAYNGSHGHWEEVPVNKTVVTFTWLGEN